MLVFTLCLVPLVKVLSKTTKHCAVMRDSASVC